MGHKLWPLLELVASHQLSVTKTLMNLPCIWRMILVFQTVPFFVCLVLSYE